MSKKNNAVLICWLGFTDIRKAESQDAHDQGPIRTLLVNERFAYIFLLHTYDIAKEDLHNVQAWLEPKLNGAQLLFEKTNVTDPIDYHSIHNASTTAIEKAMKISGQQNAANLVFHLSPGTSAMQAVLLLLGRLRYPQARIVQTCLPSHAKDKKTVLDVVLPDHIDVAKGFNIEAYQEHSEHKVFSKRQKKLELQIQPIAPELVNILLLGESGTGKSHMAECIHKWSGRKGQFIAINCAGLSDTLFESELFGHTKDAYTGATKERKGAFHNAHEGTIFLDEIGDMPLSQQRALLLALQPDKNGMLAIKKLGSDEKSLVDVRVIAATNKHLITSIQKGEFRADLYYRLAGLSFTLPSVREFELEAKKKLINHFLEKVSKQYKRTWILSDEVWQMLMQEHWAGNLRELYFMMQRICLLSGAGDLILADMVEEQLRQGRVFTKDNNNNTGSDFFPLGSGNLDDVLEKMRKEKYLEALNKTQNNTAAAARLLGVPSQVLTYWIKKNKNI